MDGKYNHEILEVVEDLHKGIDKRIPKFILKLHRFAERKSINSLHILRISFFFSRSLSQYSNIGNDDKE